MLIPTRNSRNASTDQSFRLWWCIRPSLRFTGVYVIEISRGTADGHGGGKWGLRYFEEKQQGINLIHECRNAFGGVYGPFFMPENGLVNPPAHLVIDIDPLFEGPIACQYRLHGMIPEGLRPELANKRLEMIRTFFAGPPASCGPTFSILAQRRSTVGVAVTE